MNTENVENNRAGGWILLVIVHPRVVIHANVRLRVIFNSFRRRRFSSSSYFHISLEPEFPFNLLREEKASNCSSVCINCY